MQHQMKSWCYQDKPHRRHRSDTTTTTTGGTKTVGNSVGAELDRFGVKQDKATIHRDMVSMEQDQAANNEVGGIQ